ncbi:MAG: NINE protein, partial [Lewinella sp.]|nr:NINE protein [Lewinella sp.]
MPRPKQRRLAAIMFTDIVGYSAMMQKNETLAARLRARHREVFQRLHAHYGGEIIQYFGDGTLSVFDSTADAVECAVALQRELKQTPQVPIRIGIHTGDIIFSEEDVIGDGVNIAARIQGESVPGGILISGKAHDDIKNHPELKARAMGRSTLKNIQQPIDLYAITNEGVTVPAYDATPLPQTAVAPDPDRKAKPRKKKWVAAVLALFFGIFGIHRFYLDQRNLGVLYLAMFFLGAFILPGLEQLVAIPAILGFVDFLVFLSSSRASFDERYNSEVIEEEKHRQARARAKANEPRSILEKQRRQYLEQAQASYQNYEYEEAIEALLKAIEIKYDDPDTHFFLARCFSVTEEAAQALEHLDVAVAFGFRDFDRISTEGDLAFLRVQPAYRAFAQNN